MDNDNYGNRLQNYAVVNIFIKFGFKIETLVLNQRKGHYKYIPRALKMILLPIREKKKDKFNVLKLKRKKRFKEFNVKHGIIIKKLPLWSASALRKQYKFFSVGSDQIWNPNIGYGYMTEFLSFAKQNQRIAFAPSFGTESIPKNKVEIYREGLNGFEYISVREQSGADLVYRLTQKKAEVLLDPTMMLTADEWRKISKPTSFAKGKYILKYFLGSENKKNIKRIETIAKANDCKVLELLNKSYPELYCSDPSEFIDLIDHAELICTDSFHACVFSILFDKPFLVFDRDGNGAGMGSRISTLLFTLGLERKMPGCVDEDNIFEHDYTNAYRRLEKERKKALDFLKRSLRLEDED